MSRLRPRYDGALVATIGGIVDRVRDRGRTLELDERDRLDDRSCLITGANRGLGLAIANELARRGGAVQLACRSGLEEAVGAVRQASVVPSLVQGQALDLGDLASVEQLVDRLVAAEQKLDVLVLNAGIVPREARRTVDGFDESFQVNFLANVLLVRRLLEREVIPLRAERRSGGPKAPRIVIVSSESHRTSPLIDWQTLGTFKRWGMREAVEQYGYGKLLLQTFAEELVRKTRGRVAVHSLCPGAVRTDIGREAPPWAKPALDVTMRLFFKAPKEAALPVVYLAASRALEGKTGLYLHVNRMRDARDEARSLEHGRRLWDEAERILGEAGHALGAPRACNEEGTTP